MNVHRASPVVVAAHDLPIREDWFDALIHEAQVAAGRLACLPGIDAIEALEAFVHSAQPPMSALETILQRYILGEFATRCTSSLHSHLVGEGVMRRDAPTMTLVDGHWSESAVDPLAAFGRWRDGVVATLLEVRPQRVVSRIARLVHGSYATTWSLEPLAASMRLPSAHLRAIFQRHTGITVRDYERAVRVLASLPLLDTTKVECVAQMVGYRSKKSFYSAFRRLTDLSPHAYRSLPPNRRTVIQDTLRQTVHDVLPVDIV
jgi:AraC-like DNA-binding protein